MSTTLEKFFKKLTPFLILGIALAVSVSLLFVFSYILIWGLIFGAVIWLLAAIRQFFVKKEVKPVKKEGRIIEHDSKK